MEKVEKKELDELGVVRERLLLMLDTLNRRMDIVELFQAALEDYELRADYRGEMIGLYTAQRMISDLLATL